MRQPDEMGQLASRRRCAFAAALVLLSLASAGCTQSARRLAAGPAHSKKGHVALALRVSPTTSLYDVPLDISVSGLAAGQRVTLGLSAVDAAGARWSSQATFVATGPVLDLERAAPYSAGYSGVNGMGLFESLSSARARYLDPAVRQRFWLTARTGQLSTRATITRVLVGSGVRCMALGLRGNGFFGRYCSPAAGGSQRAPVLIFGGSDGGITEAVLQAELLASRGYPALALAYFNEPGLPDALERIPLEYFAKAISWLRRSPGGKTHRVVVWGVSRGSEAALLLAVHYPELVGAVIGGSPSSVSNEAFSAAHPLPASQPAWTFAGKPLPAARPLGDPASTGDPAAVIPVQRIQGAVLLLLGADDMLWPSPEYAAAIMHRLNAYHDQFAHREIVFAGAGHAAGFAFPYDAAPVGGLGGTPVANSIAETAAWHDALTFLASVDRLS
jgi:dienelactone hydrolase